MLFAPIRAAKKYNPFLADRCDVFQCEFPSPEAFIHTLDNAPYILCETVPNEFALQLEEALSGTETMDGRFVLSTLTCHHHPVALWLSDALVKHYRLSAALGMQLHIALQEAVANAVIHGNLGLKANYRNRSEFAVTCAQIQFRLEESRYRFMPVAISVVRHMRGLTLWVCDAGSGYEEESYHNRFVALPLVHGLSIIRTQCSTVRVLRGGSIIEMDFQV